MKIMLDKSVTKIREYRERYGYEFWQLRTPLTGYKVEKDIPYGLDNGCFTEFRRSTWERMLDEAEDIRPVFVALPDVVGDARRTLDLFEQFLSATGGLPRALVLQDGIGKFSIPWHELDCVFVGGTDSFKISAECINACRAAKMLGKWVHVGRVNEPRRVMNWWGVADSIDGSGISRYDHMLEELLAAVTGNHPQHELMVANGS